MNDPDVLIVALTDTVSPRIRQLAKDMGWRMVGAPDPAEALRAIRDVQPGVVVLQVAGIDDDTTAMISFLHILPRYRPVIVLATRHSVGTEQVVRRLGVSAYVPVKRGVPDLEHFVAAALDKVRRMKEMHIVRPRPWFTRSALSPTSCL